MTTIAVSVEHGSMAADQRMTDAGPLAHVTKIHKSPNYPGFLWGLCGAVSPGLVFLEWLGSTKRDKLRLYKLISEDSRYEFTVVELSEAGIALWDGWGVRIPLRDKLFAAGTGASAALTAMEEYGKTPEEAIHAAIRRDECSGLFKEPDVEYLLPPELRRRKRG